MIEPMTRARQETTSRRWVLPFLAALVAVLATILSSASASAATTPGAETRVRASQSVAQDIARPPEVIRAGQRLEEAADRVVVVVATGVAAKGGGELSPVLLDTSAARAGTTARGLLKPGECAVVCQTVQDEAIAKGFPGATRGLSVIPDGTSAVLRGQVAAQLRAFGAAERGLINDATIGATALERGIPLITGDEALWNAVTKLGGDVRFFRPGLG